MCLASISEDGGRVDGPGNTYYVDRDGGYLFVSSSGPFPGVQKAVEVMEDYLRTHEEEGEKGCTDEPR